MATIKFLIEGDPNTGQVHMNGPLDTPMLAYWLLGEAWRKVAQRANGT